MSYDLNFWKYQPGIKLDDLDTYQKLSEGKEVIGLERLPIDRMRDRVRDTFSAWEQMDANSWESAHGVFQLFTTSQLLRVDCYGMAVDDMNKFIDIGVEFGCPVFDPQVNKRFGVS